MQGCCPPVLLLLAAPGIKSAHPVRPTAGAAGARPDELKAADEAGAAAEGPNRGGLEGKDEGGGAAAAGGLNRGGLVGGACPNWAGKL
jgi:hypothetical protein